MKSYLLQPIIQIENSDGKPLEGGKVYVYKLGITPPVLADTYFDFQDHLNTNPIILDSLGHCTIIAEDDTAYDVIIKNKDDELQFSIHNATVIGGSGDITIINPEVSVIAANGLKAEKETLLDESIQYTVSNNAINPSDKGIANFILGKDNSAESNQSVVEGNNNKILCTGNNEYRSENLHVEGTENTIILETIDKTYPSGYIDHQFSTSLSVMGNNNTVKQRGNSYGNIIAGSSNNIDIQGTANLIAGSNNSITNENDDFLYQNIVAGGNNVLSGQSYSNAIFGHNNECESCGFDLVYGSGNKLKLSEQSDRYTNVDYSLIGGEQNEAKCMFGGVILGQYNNFIGNGTSHDTSYIIGRNNSVNKNSTDGSFVFGIENQIKGEKTFIDNNYIFGKYNVIDGTENYCFGKGLESSNETSYPKFSFGTYNENKNDTFLEIGKGDSQNKANILEIKTNNEIYYRYNDEMVKLEPSKTIYFEIANTQSDLYKTFDEIFELITVNNVYPILVEYLCGAVRTYTIITVDSNSVIFSAFHDGEEIYIEYKNDNTFTVSKYNAPNYKWISESTVGNTFQKNITVGGSITTNGEIVSSSDIHGTNFYTPSYEISGSTDLVLPGRVFYVNLQFDSGLLPRLYLHPLYIPTSSGRNFTYTNHSISGQPTTKDIILYGGEDYQLQSYFSSSVRQNNFDFIYTDLDVNIQYWITLSVYIPNIAEEKGILKITNISTMEVE